MGNHVRFIRRVETCLTHSHSRVALEVSSATFILLEKTWKKSKSLQNISRRVVVYPLINISPSNVFKKKCFCKDNISKIIRPHLAALSVNGLKCVEQCRDMFCVYYMYSHYTCFLSGRHLTCRLVASKPFLGGTEK